MTVADHHRDRVRWRAAAVHPGNDRKVVGEQAKHRIGRRDDIRVQKEKILKLRIQHRPDGGVSPVIVGLSGNGHEPQMAWKEVSETYRPGNGRNIYVNKRAKHQVRLAVFVSVDRLALRSRHEGRRHRRSPFI